MGLTSRLAPNFGFFYGDVGFGIREVGCITSGNGLVTQAL